MKQNKNNFIYLIFSIACVTVFLVATLVLASVNQAIWLDEAYSLSSVKASWLDMFTLLSYDIHPPLFFVLEKIWIFFFPDTVFSMKILAILPSLLTMLLGSIFLKKEFSYKTVLIFLLSFNASQTITHWSIEIRMYSWTFFFVTMTAITAYYAFRNKTVRWWFLFLLSAVCAAYTHLYGLISAGIIYSILFIYVLVCDKKQIKNVLCVAILALLSYFPWFCAGVHAVQNATDAVYVIGSPSLELIIYFLRYPFISGTVYGDIILTLVFAVSVVIFICQKKRDGKEFFTLATFIAPVFLIVMSLIISLLLRPILLDRYIYPISGLFWLFFAINIGKIKNIRFFVGIAVILVGLSIVNYTTKFNKERLEGNSYNQLQQFIKENISSNDTLIFEPSVNEHTYGIFSYLLYTNPKIVKKVNNKLLWVTPGQSLNKHYDLVFDAPCISFADFLKSNDNPGKAWIIVGNWGENVKISVDENTEFCGEYKWLYYQFDIYRTKTPRSIVEYFNK